MRTRIAVAIVIVCAVLWSDRHADAGPILSVKPSASTLQSGDTVAIDILVSDAVDLYAFQFDLSFSSEVVAGIDVLEGVFLGGTGASTFFIPGEIDNAIGKVSFVAGSIVGPDSGISGSGLLASLVFTGLVAGLSELTLSNIVLLDSSFAMLDSTVVNGLVEVRSVAPVPEPTTLLLLGSGLAGICARRTRQLIGR